MKCNLPKNH